MNDQLLLSLLNPLYNYYNKKYIEPKYYDDDFSSNKRINRLFTAKQKELCWNKSTIIHGRDPGRWRYDAAGNPVLKSLKACNGPLCHEYDHIVPYSKGGETILRNCQILQSWANKKKGNRTDMDRDKIKEKCKK